MFSVNNVEGIKGLYISDDTEFASGECLMVLSGEVLSSPTQTSIKIGEGRHIEDDLGQFINHSCNPSTIILGNRVIALKNLSSGEEVTFDYSKNEDPLVVPFVCKCCGRDIS